MRPATRLLLAGGPRQRRRPMPSARSVGAACWRRRRSRWGWDPQEFPLHTGLLQLGFGAVLVTWRRRPGLAREARDPGPSGAAVGLVTVSRRARRAGDVLEAALVEGLGADHRSASVSRSHHCPKRRSPAASSCVPSYDSASATGQSATSATGTSAYATSSTCGSAATCPPTCGRRCCSRSMAARGRWAGRKARANH